MKKTLYITIFLSIILALGLAACGGTATQPSQTSSPEIRDYYSPEGPTVHYNKVGDKTVSVSLSHYYVEENPAEPVEVILTGSADSPNEGLTVSFTWNQVETYKPELLPIFDNLCTYQWSAVIDGKQAISQHKEGSGSDGACWVEFVFVTE